MSVEVKKSRTAYKFKQRTISSELATTARQRIHRALWKVPWESSSDLCLGKSKEDVRYPERDNSMGIVIITSMEIHGPSLF